MRKPFLLVLSMMLLSYSCKKEDTPTENANNVPFPHHTQYAGDYIQPANYDQNSLDNHLTSFYNQWKDEYLRNDCSANQYYVYSGDGATTISEAHGYGMIIACLIAGYDKKAKVYFDGMYRYFKNNPSNINNQLMDWQQISCNESASDDDDSASDGDIDIAYALLLAHKQWGSAGAINYHQEALTMLHAIMQDEINQDTWTVKLGDWSDASDANYYYGTRSSDFIPSHFKSFASISGNADWNLVVDECYNLINAIQSNQSAATGLLPDFILNTNTTPTPASPNYLEDTNDGSYYYNACRFPWRIGTDYLLHNDTRAKEAVTKINDWLITKTNNNPSLISNGYLLDGTAIYNWNDATFLGPFAVGAMADTAHQAWLDELYLQLITENDVADGDYYSNTIKLLSLFVISRNYWS